MSVLIGLVDQRIQKSDSVDWATNKIGGLPTWMNSEPSPRIPVCTNCGQTSSLVSQIYCPLGGSEYHRCIYLFVCPGVCSKQQNGWRAFRSLKLDTSYLPNNDYQTKAESQRSAEECFDELWTQEQDDWGDGKEAYESVEMSCDMDKLAGDKGQVEVSTSLPTELDCVLVTESVEIVEDYNTVESLSQLTLSDGTGQPCLDPPAEYAGAGGSTMVAALPVSSLGCGESEEPLMDEAIELADTERWNAMARLLNTKLEQDPEPSRSNVDCTIVFDSYYLSVVDEPYDQVEVSDHVTDLIRNYERSEGKHLQMLISERPTPSKGKECSSEVYETTELKHGDKFFYKFMKRLQRCPQQCVRYERGGDPLLLSSLQEQTIKDCVYCGGKKVFELELLPPLIPFLKADDDTPCEVEFGTVLVFTCERNCWPADPDLQLLEESIILQEDPDIHLYR